MKYIVYCTTCTENGKIYIGVHKTENPDVFDKYIGNGIEINYTIKNPKTAFQRALKKYGYSKFKRSTLYVFDTEEEAYAKEAEIVTLDFIKRRDNYNTALGGIHPGTKYKSVYQYDLEGNFIKEWYSVEEAVKHFNCNDNRFNMVIKDKRSAFNCYWSYEYYDKLDTTDYVKSFHDCETYQYDLEGNFIKSFSSIKDVLQEFTTLNRNSVAGARSAKVPIQGYYFLSPEVNVFDVIKSRELYNNLIDKSISKYKNGKRIQTYSSISNAAKQNHISSNAIKKSILNNEGIWSFGFAEEYQNHTEAVPVKVQQLTMDGKLVKVWDSLSSCMKEFPKAKAVIKGERTHTKGFKFKVS